MKVINDKIYYTAIRIQFSLICCFCCINLNSQNFLRFEQGIHRPNLNWLGTLEEEKQLIDKMNEIGIKSIRLNPTASQSVGDFIEHVKYANQLNIKVNMVISITAFPEFFVNGATKRPEVGIWGPRYKFSDLVPENIGNWCEQVFNRLQNAGAIIELVEFGNESNWIDFNGDLPYIEGGKFYDYTTDWNDSSFIKIREGILKYGQALKFVKDKIDLVWGENDVQLITNGAVEGYRLTDWAITNGGSILSTAVMLDLLKGGHPQLPAESENYLQNADGIGIHFYPKVIELDIDIAKKTVANEIRDIMTPIINVVSIETPIWVTEWNYNKGLFQNNSEEDRYIMLKNLLEICHGLPYNWKKFYLFTFDNSSHKIYENGAFLPASKIFNDYVYDKDAWNLNDTNYKIQNSFSSLYLRGYNQTNTDNNDSYITITDDINLSHLNWVVERTDNNSETYYIKNENTELYLQGSNPANSVLTQNSLDNSSLFKWYIMPSTYKGEYHIKNLSSENFIWTNSTSSNTHPTLSNYQNSWNSMRWKLKSNSPTLGNSNYSLEQDIVLFPNPSKDEINIITKKNSALLVSIYNSIGRQVSSRNLYTTKRKSKINISKWPAGVYFFKISISDKSIIKKVIKL
ncbi:T9SS type A sorting domain-containing protein [Polaribacter porphyrae]|uniref:Secretion system C-terminal sorting domain-containing protein n=1 Tax=Polaribacter porphyrae TaxID=1137780 RepID=A0A2S7WQC7_9FLAO|nr:T9SS type A sorting domain-containing protein [Polaribacter porphyrae]PQJ79820.1 hypothetical protein BTO18_11820 [Polaribacter porphyrae]